MENDRAGSFLLGLTIGGAIGGLLAVAMAPRPGEETRADLRTRGIELKARAQDVASQLRERGRATADDQRGRFQQAVAEGREAAEKTRADMLERYEKAKRPPEN